jgi:hypothetical protein
MSDAALAFESDGTDAGSRGDPEPIEMMESTVGGRRGYDASQLVWRVS